MYTELHSDKVYIAVDEYLTTWTCVHLLRFSHHRVQQPGA